MAETDRAITYMPHRTPKGYTHSSGLSFPIRGMEEQTFLLPLLKFGTSGTPIHIKTTTIPLFQIESTSAIASGTTRSVYLKQTQTVDHTVGYARPFEFIYASEYRSGPDGTVLRVQCDYGTTGHAGGIMSVLSSEIKLPNMSLTRGGLYALELRVNAQALSSWGSAGPVAFMRIRSTGAGVAWINSGAYFMIFRGHTAAADALVSLTSQTVKCSFSGDIPTTTVRYLLFSQMQDGLGLGVDGTRMVITDTTKAVDLHLTSASTTGSIDFTRIKAYSTGETASGYLKALRIEFYKTGGGTGTSTRCTNFRMYLGTSTAISGITSVEGLELRLPGAVVAGAGSFHGMDIVINAPANCDTSGHITSFFALQLSGATGTELGHLEDDSYLFNMNCDGGLTGNSGHIYQTGLTKSDANVASTVRCKIDGVVYWIPLWDTVDGS